MRKRILFDINFRIWAKKVSLKALVFKYLNANSTTYLEWKNKSFKRMTKSLKLRNCCRIRDFCIVSGRARGLSKNYYYLSRNNFKSLQSIGLLPGVYKFSA